MVDSALSHSRCEESQMRKQCRVTEEKHDYAVQFLNDLKVHGVGRSVIRCCGKLFQIAGAEWRKAHSANTHLTQST